MFCAYVGYNETIVIAKKPFILVSIPLNISSDNYNFRKQFVKRYRYTLQLSVTDIQYIRS